MAKHPILKAENLCVEYRLDRRFLNVLRNIDITIEGEEIRGLVGESGSGKSTLGLALMRALPENGYIRSGSILFEGRDLVTLDRSDLTSIWGKRITFVPQHPMEALNPSLTIGFQTDELALLLGAGTTIEARAQSIRWLTRVQIPDPEKVLTRYPHQLSGGMLQRVMIAMALASRPALIILDEPTTALDVTTQAVMLDLFRELIRQEKAAALYISHDLGTVSELCDTVTVLYAGEVMEYSPVDRLFEAPAHPYTTGLLACLPGNVRGRHNRLMTIKGSAPSLEGRSYSCVFADRCPLADDTCRREKPSLLSPRNKGMSGRAVRCFHWEQNLSEELSVQDAPHPIEGTDHPEENLFSARHIEKSFVEKPGLGRILGKKEQVLTAVRDVSMDIAKARTVGLVGESGSGKTTFARAVVALDEADSGTMELSGFELSRGLKARRHDILRGIRMIFQNPADALNPYHPVGFSIGRTYKKLNTVRLSGPEIRTAVLDLLTRVGLGPDYYDRYPHQLSGGEKQRVVIARAFAADPSLIVADEPTSSLDVSVQAVILNLLKDLRKDQGVSYLFISHDLEVIEYLSEYIAVMYLGDIVEQGTNEQIIHPPWHPYTEALLAAAPSIDPSRRKKSIRLTGDIPSPRERPSGCPFHTRCPRYIGDICARETPPERISEQGHRIRCHYEHASLLRLQESTQC